MGTGTRRRSFSGELVRLAVVLAFASAASGLYVSDGFAGDLAAQAAPTGQASAVPIGGNVLAQTNTLSQPRERWLQNFHISGFLNETAGMWINPTNLKAYTPSRNNLATARTWLQADVNYRIGSANQFFLRTWFVYEPPYSFNTANNHAYACKPDILGPEGCGNEGSQMYRLNGFYNQYNVRDAWWKLTTGPLTLYLGNQIVVWGQSLAFRVGDVINPQDTTWAFGFANLEQSRIPQWMIHPILNLPDWGPLNSNFVEGVLIPGAQPMWNSWQYPDGRFDNSQGNAGRVSTGFPAAMHGPSARFDAHYPYFVRGVNIQTLPQPFNPFLMVNPGVPNIIPSPISRFAFMCSQFQPVFFGPGSNNGKNPTPKNLIRPCDLSKGVNLAPWHVPAVTFGNMQEGLRLHTLWGSNEFTALYYNAFQNYPIVAWQPYTQTFPFVYEPVQYVGMTWDRPIPMPARVAEYFPLVARAEAVYQNHAPFIDFNLTRMQDFRYSDVVTWMLALDLDQAYAPWLTTTGNLSANLEILDPIIMDASQSMSAGPNGGTLPEPAVKNDVSLLFHVGTSFWWNAFAPDWAMIYQLKGTTFALFPSIQFNPPWTNDYFAKIGVIYVMSSDMQANGTPFFKGQNMITITGQYNFSAM